MVLVVLLHVSGWYGISAGIGPSPWFDISAALTPMRMPTFFLVSGMLAQGAIDRDFRKVLRRSGNLYFVYLLWTTLISLRFIVPSVRGDRPAPTLDLLMANAVVPGYYGYLWALPLFYLIGTLCRRTLKRYAPLIVIPALALSYWATDIDAYFSPYYPDVIELNWSRETMQTFAWFYLGLTFKQAIVARVDAAGPGKLIGATAIAGVLIALTLSTGATGRAAQMVETLLYMAVMICVVALVQATPVNRFLAWIGRGTLPVYILHWWLLLCATLAVKILPPPHMPLAVGWVVPVVLTLAITCIARVAGPIVAATPLDWTLNGPFKDKRPRERADGSTGTTPAVQSTAA